MRGTCTVKALVAFCNLSDSQGRCQGRKKVLEEKDEMSPVNFMNADASD